MPYGRSELPSGHVRNTAHELSARDAQAGQGAPALELVDDGPLLSSHLPHQARTGRQQCVSEPVCWLRPVLNARLGL
jgi:hypothetical protein